MARRQTDTTYLKEIFSSFRNTGLLSQRTAPALVALSRGALPLLSYQPSSADNHRFIEPLISLLSKRSSPTSRWRRSFGVRMSTDDGGLQPPSQPQIFRAGFLAGFGQNRSAAAADGCSEGIAATASAKGQASNHCFYVIFQKILRYPSVRPRSETADCSSAHQRIRQPRFISYYRHMRAANGRTQKICCNCGAHVGAHY